MLLLGAPTGPSAPSSTKKINTPHASTKALELKKNVTAFYNLRLSFQVHQKIIEPRYVNRFLFFFLLVTTFSIVIR